jgi:glycosyltransferase involved in cell wall biosynthesis
VRAFVGVSPPVTDYYRQRKPGPVVTVNNGVPALDIMEAVEAIRERADRSLGVPMLVAIGRLTEEKGHDVLFKAFGLMHESGLSFRARIVGDGPLRDRLEALAGTLGIAHLVEVTGLKADVVEDLASADIYVSPSHTEGFGRAVVEAMAAGLPVVATDIPAMRGIIEDGVEGVLVPAGDPAAMAAALGRLLGSRDGWPALSAAARRRALSFDISQTAQRMRQVYDLVISGRPSDQIVAALAAEPTSQWPTRLDRQESA